MMTPIRAELPPIDHRYATLSIECDFILENGMMANGFVKYFGSTWQAYCQKDGSCEFVPCNPVSWRPRKKDER